MGDLVDEGGEAENVAEEDELVLVVRALLAGAREELDGVEPFVVGEQRLPCKRVEVVDEGLDQLQFPRVLDQAVVQRVDARWRLLEVHAATKWFGRTGR